MGRFYINAKATHKKVKTRAKMLLIAVKFCRYSGRILNLTLRVGLYESERRW